MGCKQLELGWRGRDSGKVSMQDFVGDCKMLAQGLGTQIGILERSDQQASCLKRGGVRISAPVVRTVIAERGTIQRAL